MPEPERQREIKTLLGEAYDHERARLLPLAGADDPQGEYRFPAFGEGDADAKALLIGEAPGAEETRLQRPFVGRAGRQLDELIRLFGVERADVYITNVVKYRPVVRTEKSVRNRTPLPGEVAASLPLLLREIELIRPNVILTLGNTPLKAICQFAGEKPPTIGACHGACKTISIGKSKFTLIPLYHPASGIYNRKLVGVMERDAVFAGETIRGLSTQETGR